MDLGLDGAHGCVKHTGDGLIHQEVHGTGWLLVARHQRGMSPARCAWRRMTLSPLDAMLCDARYNVPMLNAFVFYVGLSVRAAGWPARTRLASWLLPAFSRLAALSKPRA